MDSEKCNLIYLFIYGLFNGSDDIVLNDRNVNE
jgi:hypothetical protein